MIRGISRRQFKKLSKDILNWCPYYLGYPPYRAKLPQLRINYVTNTHYADWIRVKYRTSRITLYPKLIFSKRELVKYVIHEYVHYLQFYKWEYDFKYVELSIIYGYNNNPYEIEARQLASKFTPHIYRRISNKQVNETISN